MTYKFQPNNYYDAFRFWLAFPFYTVSDLFAKQHVIFKQEEIISVEKYVYPYTNYKIIYRTELFEGEFFREHLNEKQFSNIIQQKNRDSSPLYLKIPFLLSPVTWAVAFLFVYGFISTTLGKYLFFKGILHPELLVSPFCNVVCVKKISTSLNMILLILGLVIGELLIGLYFFSYVSKKVKKVSFYQSIRRTSVLLILMTVFTASEIVSICRQENGFQKIALNVRILYTPEYFNYDNNRQIASEIMGKEIRKQK